MYTYNRALVLATTEQICFPHSRADRQVIHFMPEYGASGNRWVVGESAAHGGGIELFKL